MQRVALTGNVASGKSTVARLLATRGAAIIDADEIVRDLQQSGSPILERIVKEFGREILTREGDLNRSALRAIIVQDPSARDQLNRIVHPAVHRRRMELEASAAAKGAHVVVHDIPLLFEVMDPGEFPTVILVDAPEQTRLNRLRARGLSKEEAVALMATQMNPTEKRAGATHIIDNDGTLGELEERTFEVWKDVVNTARDQLDSGRGER